MTPNELLFFAALLSVLFVYLVGCGVAYKATSDRVSSPWSWYDDPHVFMTVVGWPLALPVLLGITLWETLDREAAHKRKLEDIKEQTRRTRELNEANQKLDREIQNLCEPEEEQFLFDSEATEGDLPEDTSKKAGTFTAEAAMKRLEDRQQDKVAFNRQALFVGDADMQHKAHDDIKEALQRLTKKLKE